MPQSFYSLIEVPLSYLGFDVDDISFVWSCEQNHYYLLMTDG